MLTKFSNVLGGLITYLLGYAFGSVAGSVSPGYSTAIFTLLAVPVIILVGPRVEVWLIEIGWIK